MKSELLLNEKINESNTEITVAGEVDIYTAHQFKQKLYDVLETTKTDLIINCSGLNYIDSTGLGILVGTLKKVKENDKDIYITGLKDNIKKLFVITGLDKLFILEQWFKENNYE